MVKNWRIGEFSNFVEDTKAQCTLLKPQMARSSLLSPKNMLSIAKRKRGGPSAGLARQGATGATSDIPISASYYWLSNRDSPAGHKPQGAALGE